MIRFYSVEIFATGTKTEKAARAALRNNEFFNMREAVKEVQNRLTAAGLHVGKSEIHNTFARLYLSAAPTNKEARGAVGGEIEFK